jgi:hypothetical protein
MLPQEWFTKLTRSPEMKSFLSRIAIALLIASLASVAVFAKAKKETVRFATNIKVNGTVVNKGVYDVKFDDKTGELSIMKDNKVIARATATVAKRDQKAREFAIKSSGTGDETQLISVTFAGADHDLVVGSSQASR